jgi:hypothetical protein
MNGHDCWTSVTVKLQSFHDIKNLMDLLSPFTIFKMGMYMDMNGSGDGSVCVWVVCVPYV